MYISLRSTHRGYSLLSRYAPFAGYSGLRPETRMSPSTKLKAWTQAFVQFQLRNQTIRVEV